MNKALFNVEDQSIPLFNQFKTLWKHEPVPW